MAQGFFTADQSVALPSAVRRALGGVLRFSTGRRLHHKLFENAVDAETWSGFTHDQYGCDTMRIAWTPESLAELDLRVGSESWTSGFQHELVVHLMGGGALPLVTTHAGDATATLVSGAGYCVTNFHLVSASIWYRDLTSDDGKAVPRYPDVNGIPHRTFVHDGVAAPHMKLRTDDGHDLGPVRLCYHDASIDFAVLKLEEPPVDVPVVPLRDGPALRHERIWQFGYPPRSARTETLKAFLGYEDACGQLTYSPGLLLSNPANSMWHTDADAVFGSSGSAVFGDDGALIGVRCGGGASMLPKAERYQFNQVTDVYSLRNILSDSILSVRL